MADEIPSWLYPLILADFDTSRGYSNGKPPKTKRFFCTRCKMDPFCDEDLKDHESHLDRVLKAIKSTKQYGVHSTVLSKILNVSEVDTGSINGSYIHFLRRRRHVHGSDQSDASTSKSCDRECHGGRLCDRCGWKLNNKGARFCSVECKYKPALRMKEAAAQESESPPPPPSSMVVEQDGESPSGMTSNREEMESPPPLSMVVGEDSESSPPSSMVAEEEGESASASLKKRNRKSLPRRSPFF